MQKFEKKFEISSEKNNNLKKIFDLILNVFLLKKFNVIFKNF